jgi:uncharacterized membrane protein YccC
LRTAVVTLGGFAIGRWALGSVAAAVFATFTGLALTGIADFGGPMRGRAAACAAAAAAGAGLVAVGTWCSTAPVWAQCAVMFGTGGAICLVALLGGYVAAAATAVILFYVVAAGSPAQVSTIAERVDGVAIGGALAAIAGVALWPAAPERDTSRTLGEALDSLAGRLRRLGDVPTGPAARAPQTPEVRTVVDTLADRPAAPTRASRGELYLLNDVERLDRLVTALEASPGAVSASDAEAVVACAGDLSAIAIALRTRPPPRSGSGGLTAGPASSPSPFGPVARVAAVTAAAAAHAESALGLRGNAVVVDASHVEAAPGRMMGIAHGARRLAANLTVSSVYLQDAIRLGLGLALATAAVRAFSLQHGFWVAFATLTVVKSNVRATGRSVRAALVGTMIGFGAAAAIVAILGANTEAYLVLLPVVIATAIYANVAVNFLAGQAGFTVAIIVLFNLLGPAGWRIGIVRVEDVVAGGLVGLLVGALIWPRGPSAVIGPAVAELLGDASTYLAAVIVEAVGTAGTVPPEPDGRDVRDLRHARRRAVASAVRADDTIAHFIGEHARPADAQRWAELISRGNRLWYAGDLLWSRRSQIELSDRGALGAIADRIVSGYAAVAAGLCRERQPPDGVAVGQLVRGRSELTDWLEDLAAGAGPGGPQGTTASEGISLRTPRRES